MGFWAVTVGSGAGCTWLRKMSVTSLSLAHWLSVSGSRGELVDGVLRALVMSKGLAIMMSILEAEGIGILCGNHCTESLSRSARLLHTHTR